jgi:hypothetical protein
MKENFMSMRFLSALALMVLLTACAPDAARVADMVSDITPDTLITETSPLKANIDLQYVVSGYPKDPARVATVAIKDFHTALKNSLKVHALLGGVDGKYKLHVTLESLTSPFVGADSHVTSSIIYTLTDKYTGEVLFNETVITIYTAEFAEAFYGINRFTLAAQGSIRDNNNLFKKKLVAAT